MFWRATLVACKHVSQDVEMMLQCINVHTIMHQPHPSMLHAKKTGESGLQWYQGQKQTLSYMHKMYVHVHVSTLLRDCTKSYTINSLVPPPSLLPRFLPAFKCCMRKTRELGKTYQANVVADGIDLYNSSRTKSSGFHLLQHSRDKFYQAPRAMFKSWEEPGQKTMSQLACLG